MRVDIVTELIELDCQSPAWRIVDLIFLTYYYERFTESRTPTHSGTNGSRSTLQQSIPIAPTSVSSLIEWSIITDMATY